MQSTKGLACTQLTVGSAETREGKDKETQGHLGLKIPDVNICDMGEGHFDIPSHYSEDANEPESRYDAVLSLCWGTKDQSFSYMFGGGIVFVNLNFQKWITWCNRKSRAFLLRKAELVPNFFAATYYCVILKDDFISLRLHFLICRKKTIMEPRKEVSCEDEMNSRLKGLSLVPGSKKVLGRWWLQWWSWKLRWKVCVWGEAEEEGGVGRNRSGGGGRPWSSCAD